VTRIVNDPGEMGLEDLIEDEEIVITMTQAGYVKSVAAGSFKVQGRGGRGVQGAKLRDEDFVEQIVHTSTHAFLLLFSNKAGCFVFVVTRSPSRSAPLRVRQSSIS